MAKLVAHVAQVGVKPDWIELVIPPDLDPAEYRRQIVEGQLKRSWLETTDGDYVNLNHILLLSVLSR